MQEGKTTYGVLQQDPRWWGTLAQILDIEYAVTSFIVGRPGTPGLRKIQLTKDPVIDCYRVQGWAAPDPDEDREGFWASRETQNYVRRLDEIQELIDNPNYFKD